MSRRIFSILRRHLKADRLLSFSLIIMRAYSYCRIHNFFYIVTPESLHCERYFRFYLKCELAPPDAKTERFFKEKERLAFEIAAVYTKISRLRKQYRAIMKKLRDLGSRENRNILELEIDKILSDRQFSILKALNSLSPRLSSFTVSVGKKSTNSFLRLLNFPNKNAKIS
jgi:hypothetical protein